VLTYLALIAVTNLCLGYLLGMSFPLRRDTYCTIPLNAQQDLDFHDTQLPAAHGDAPNLDAESPSSAEPTDRGEVPLEETKPDDASAKKGAWTTPTSWDDFAQQLRTIKERIRYARLADDKRLGREVAIQLENCAQSWFSQLQGCLDGNVATTSSELLTQGGEAHLEMCLAQIETTLTNISQLDWSQAAGTVLNDLEREVESLEKSQRRASAAK